MIAKFIFHTILGWQIVGKMDPHIKKSILVVAPHTSWHDFYIGVLARAIIRLPMHFVGKKELFDSALGWYFRWMGGTPIDRSKSQNTVDQIVQIFNEKEEFRLAISPEGTRKKVIHWKTGFYYIAQKANVPIIPVVFDYGLKQVQLKPPFFTTPTIENDLALLQSYYKGAKGKIEAYT